MGIRTMFDHKYPITNLHEVDLTFMHEDIDRMISILEEWETIIDEIKAGIALYKDLEVRVQVLESEISTIKNELVQLRTNYIALNSDVKILKYDVDVIKNRINIIETTLEGLWTYIDNRIDYVIAKSYQDDLVIMNKLNQMKYQMQQQIDDLYALVEGIITEITNPWHGLDKMSIEENVKLIYSDLADKTPTATDYFKLGLTADDYSDYDLTALNYAKFGYDRLHLNYVFSPVYGFRQDISNVLTSIVDFLRGTLSASQYSALDLTADEYTALDLDAATYYSYQSNVGLVGLTGEGLTSSEYSQLGIIN